MGTRTRFEKEDQGNSEMAHWHVVINTPFAVHLEKIRNRLH